MKATFICTESEPNRGKGVHLRLVEENRRPKKVALTGIMRKFTIAANLAVKNRFYVEFYGEGIRGYFYKTIDNKAMRSHESQRNSLVIHGLVTLCISACSYSMRRRRERRTSRSSV